MVLTVMPLRLRMWRRRAFDMRERQGIALATVQTYLGTKSLTSAEVTEVTAGLSA